jgi:hypothetical protein
LAEDEKYEPFAEEDFNSLLNPSGVTQVKKYDEIDE